MPKRSDVLELAVLGILADTPLHGYELRKRVTAQVGWGRVLSYGSLYPCLKAMLRKGWISADTPAPRGSGRPRISYEITTAGKEHFAAAVDAADPSAWDDDAFGVRMSLFGRTDPMTRLRILEGRRARMEERMANLREALSRTGERADRYTLELQQHGLDATEREVRWLSELIDTERHEPRERSSD